ncbi:MAG: tyrosine-type recombinase/integrase, partial [Prevotella sp.]|nr:tyrosine-type recombinase/integrase [Prevotella sp.]
KWIAAKAGINKNVSFNTSRHTFATLTLEASNDIKTVSKLLGHKSILTTQIYAEVQMKSKEEAVNRLNGKFGGVRKSV